jgi:ABC-type transporter Mla subunit MlaD
MPGTSTQFKLGLFALAAIIALAATAVGLGIRAATKDLVRYETYFDESAQGLDPGAPVRYRGVRIGNVANISIAPDRRQVRVGLAIDSDVADELELARHPPGLRTQLTIQGITGVKFIDMDFVDADKHPAPPLPFTPGPRYIPSRPSLFKGLEDRLGDLPELVERASSVIDKIGATFDDVREQKLAAKAGALLDHFDGTNQEIHRFMADLNARRLPARAAATLDKTNALTAKIDATLTKLDRVDELIASAKRATDSFGEVGRTTRASSRELERTLRDVGDAARALREFMDALEREPDMLLKGKARAK